MIGLAATAQVAIVPTWFGLAIVLGTTCERRESRRKQRAMSLLINVAGIVIASFAAYAALRMRGDSLQAFKSETRSPVKLNQLRTY
jgi:hypothetical protein